MRTTTRNETGAVLITTVVAILMVASLSAALLTTVAVEDSKSRSNDDIVTGDFLADGAAEIAEKLVLRSVVNWMELPRGVVQYEIGGHPIEFEIARAGSHWVEFDPDGVRVVNQPVLIKAWTDSNGYRREISRLINVGVTPLFQFTVFYDADLEILPFPNMTISGRVHTNRDMYVGSDNTLTFDTAYLHAVGDIYRQRKDAGLPSGGHVVIRGSDGSGNYYPMDSKFEFDDHGIASVSGFDSAFLGFDRNGDGDYIDAGELSPWVVEAIERWGGTVQSAAHGLRELVAPDVRSIKRFVTTDTGSGGDYDYDPNTDTYYEVPRGTGAYRKGHYHRAADLVILNDRMILNGISSPLPPGVLREVEMYDAREGKDIRVTEIDLQALRTNDLWPENGLMYLSRSGASPSQPDGVRLTNGAELEAPLTVVSENQVFIHGDYNNVDKKGAAVIGDAVSVLSESWDDSKRSGTLPVASETEVMASIITGSYETSEGNYNGGFENMIRFHENWENVRCTILGSFVNLFDSEQAMGHWRYGGDSYIAPERVFDFDSDYRQISNLPPFTPVVARVRHIAWYEGGSFEGYLEEEEDMEP